MEICGGNKYKDVEHEHICYDAVLCPLCAKIDEIVQLKKDNFRLDTELANLERLQASIKKGDSSFKEEVKNGRI